MRSSSGFSAFELAVTIAIITIIAAISMPNFLKWLRGYRLRGATANLVADLEMAKIRAIRENTFVVIQLHSDRYEVFVDNGENAENWIWESDEQRLRNRALPANVSIDLGATTLDLDQTRFNGQGIPPEVTNPETITLTNSSSSKQIIVNRLGYINVQ